MMHIQVLSVFSIENNDVALYPYLRGYVGVFYRIVQRTGIGGSNVCVLNPNEPCQTASYDNENVAEHFQIVSLKTVKLCRSSKNQRFQF